MGLLSSILQARPNYVKQVNFALLLILLSISTGVVGFMLIEGFSFLEALYMTIITISTVGFTEVRPLSDPGRIFTAILIITNIGIFTYAISLVASFLIEGQLRYAFKDLRVFNQIKKLTNHTIICGYGRNGKEAAEELAAHHQAFVIIETDPDKIEELRNAQKYLFIHGDASQDEVLIKAGLDKAKALISALPKDADNVFVALTAKEINPNLNIICRASEEASENKLKRAGATHVIMPERIGGSHMAKLVMKPDIIEFFQLLSEAGGVSLYFEELDMKKLHEDLKNKTISDLEIRKRTGANIIGLKTKDGEYIVNPAPDTKVGQCIKLIVLGDEEQIEQFNRFILDGSPEKIDLTT